MYQNPLKYSIILRVVTAPQLTPLPEDGGSMVLRSVGILPQNYTVSQPKKP